MALYLFTFLMKENNKNLEFFNQKKIYFKSKGQIKASLHKQNWDDYIRAHLSYKRMIKEII